MAAERPLLSISRKTLDEGPREVRTALPAAWLTTKLAEGAEPEAVPYLASLDGKVEAWITPAGGENFLVKGRVHATIDGTCGRCLGEAHVPVDAELTALLVPKVDSARPVKGKRHKDSEGEFEFDPNEADVETYDGETVVLDHLVREAILLELPISPLCSEDCAGMASDPAVADRLAQARVDPRLQKLAELRDKLSTDGKKK